MADELCSVCGKKLFIINAEYSMTCSVCGARCGECCIRRFWRPEPDNFRSRLPVCVSLCPTCLTAGQEQCEAYCKASDECDDAAHEMLKAYKALCAWSDSARASAMKGANECG